MQKRKEFSLNISLKDNEHITKTPLKSTIAFVFRTLFITEIDKANDFNS